MPSPAFAYSRTFAFYLLYIVLYSSLIYVIFLNCIELNFGIITVFYSLRGAFEKYWDWFSKNAYYFNWIVLMNEGASFKTILAYCYLAFILVYWVIYKV